MQNLTVIILTKNEEKNIKKCISSFGKSARRFVIVDSGSTDNTKQIIEELAEELSVDGIKIDFYENQWIDYATQFNWGLMNTNIDSDWVMRIDADEELLSGLRDAIDARLSALPEDVTGVVVNRRMVFMGKWIRHGGMYPTKVLRIFRYGHARCEQRIMDEHIIIFDGRTIYLNQDFMDKNEKNLAWWTEKHNWYSDREVKDHLATVEGTNDEILVSDSTTGGQASMKRKIKNGLYYRLPLFFRAHLYFVLRYYVLLGFLDGKEGRIYHFLQGYWYRFLVDAKMYELENDR